MFSHHLCISMKSFLLGFLTLMLYSMATVGHTDTVFSDVIPSHAQNMHEFVPQGWKILRQVSGDLNADGLADAVMVIEKQDPKNIIAHDGMGAKVLNLNPRYLLVALQENPHGRVTRYQRHTLNTTLIPSEHSKESVCLVDPLEDGEIRIHRQSLYVRLNYWLSCGSWEMGSNTMQFKLRQKHFKLIGLEHESTHRGTGDMTHVSVNYLTQKKKQTTGHTLSGDNERPKTTWVRLPVRQLYELETVRYDAIIQDYQLIDDGSW